MLTLADLEGIKLVSNEEYFATVPEAQQELENIFQQASQSWGIRRQEGVILRLARDLKITMALAMTAEEGGRMLKGAQMELGRVKKQRDTQAQLLLRQTETLDNLLAQVGALKAQNGDLNIEVLQLKAAALDNGSK